MLEELQEWYLAQCDGNWEHQYGVVVDTLENPGWRLRVDLTGTELESKSFVPIKDTDPKAAWIHRWVEERVFEARCGPRMLTAAIRPFLTWAKS